MSKLQVPKALMLTEREKKLLRLALDAAASEGEIANAALRLIESWRKREFKVEELTEFDELSYDWGTTVINFGKYRGRPIREVPLDYLLWVLENCEERHGLLMAIRIYLRIQ